jgi:replicative DNA helicase
VLKANYEAEQAVLGAVLMDSAKAMPAADTLAFG